MYGASLGLKSLGRVPLGGERFVTYGTMPYVTLGRRNRRQHIHGIDADASAFIQALFQSPNSSSAPNEFILNRRLITAIDRLVKELKDSGLWSLCVAIYPFIGGFLRISSSFRGDGLNLKNPQFTTGAYCVTWGNTFHDEFGARNNLSATANSISNIPGTTLANYDWHYSWYTYRQKGVGLGDMTTIGNTGFGRVNFTLSENDFSYFANNASRDLFVGYSSGFYAVTRTSTTLCNSYYNGTLIDSNTTLVSTGNNVSNLSFLLNPTTVGQAHSAYMSFISVGSGLTTDLVIRFSQIVQDFQTRLGRSV